MLNRFSKVGLSQEPPRVGFSYLLPGRGNCGFISCQHSPNSQLFTSQFCCFSYHRYVSARDAGQCQLASKLNLLISFIFPLFVFPATVIGFIYRHLAIGYLSTGRDLRRMESNTRSPIFANFGELLEGIVTVRAFSAEQRFLDNHNAKVDLTNKVSASCIGSNQDTHPFTDVVYILDDQQMALAPIRLPRCSWRLHYNALCSVWLRRCRTGRCVHNLLNVIHDERVLGLPILDRLGVGPQVSDSLSV